MDEENISNDNPSFPFDKLTYTAKKIFARATNSAAYTGHLYIYPEHLLFGLMIENNGNAQKILEDLGLRKDDLTSLFKQTGIPLSNVEIVLTEQVREIIFFADAEAIRFKQPHIGTEHLLLGIFRIGPNEAKHFLENTGIAFEQVDARIATLMNSPSWLPEQSLEPQTNDAYGELYATIHDELVSILVREDEAREQHDDALVDQLHNTERDLRDRIKQLRQQPPPKK